MGNSLENLLWEQAIELASMSVAESRLELVKTVDRFTWDTGSDEDRARIASLEESISIKKSVANYFTRRRDGK